MVELFYAVAMLQQIDLGKLRKSAEILIKIAVMEPVRPDSH